jgi:signal peptidase I
MGRLESAVVAVVLALLLVVVTLDLTGHHLFVVAGASMEPAVAKGSLVVVRPTIPAILAVGDIVTFQHSGQTVTHRIAAIDEHGDARVFTTKGDANEAADPEPVSFDDRVGLLVAQVPLAGYVLGLLQLYGRLVSVALALVIAAWALREWHVRPFPLPIGV